MLSLIFKHLPPSFFKTKRLHERKPRIAVRLGQECSSRALNDLMWSCESSIDISHLDYPNDHRLGAQMPDDSILFVDLPLLPPLIYKWLSTWRPGSLSRQRTLLSKNNFRPRNGMFVLAALEDPTECKLRILQYEGAYSLLKCRKTTPLIT